MRLINNLKLKYQLSLLILIALIMMILLQIMYYSSFYSLTSDRAAKFAEDLMAQIALNVDNTTSTIERDSITISYSKYVQELLISNDAFRNTELNDFVAELFSHTRNSNRNINSIILLNNDGRQISDAYHYNFDIMKKLEEMYNFRDPAFNKAMFTSVVRDKSDAFYYYSYISPILSSYDMTENYSKIGVCIFLLDTRELDKMVNTAELTKNSLFLVLDSDNHVIASNKGLKAGNNYENVFWHEGVNGVVKDQIEYEGKQSIVQYQKIDSVGWKIISVIPIKELTSDMKQIVSYGVWLGLIMVVLLISIGAGFIYSTTRPVMLIIRFLSKIGEQDIKQRLRIQSKNEVGIIADNINQMLDKVEVMTKKVVENQTFLYEAELSKNLAKLSALQSQINPHFLYNTLNCLSNIGIAYDVTEVVSISSAMSRIFRYSIKGDDMVNIEDEISCIVDYLLIMDIRYKGKFETVIDIEPSVLNMKTSKMVLQPIVENAMYHGLERKSGKGRLSIQGFVAEGDYLQFDIEDNGVGMNEQQLSHLLQGIRGDDNVEQPGKDEHGIGLANINKRVKLQFGSQYGLDVDSEQSVGTKVTLRLPIIASSDARSM